jgi:lipopolysaccharide/colanic/teichoic acid biosynthesis glycosyltransferase
MTAAVELWRWLDRHRAKFARGIDVGGAALAWPLALLLRTDLSGVLERPVEILLEAGLVASLALVIFDLTGAHRGFWRYATLFDLVAVARAAALIVLANLLVLFLISRLDAVPRSVPVLHLLIMLVLLGGARVIYLLVAWRPAPASTDGDESAPEVEPVLLVGAGDSAALTIDLLRHTLGPQVKPVGILDDKAGLGRDIRNVPILGRLADFRRAVAQLTVKGLRPTMVLVTRPPSAFDALGLQQLREQADASRVRVNFLTDMLHVRETRPEPPAAQGGLALVRTLPGLARAPWKRALDLVCGLILVTLASPVLAAIAIAVWLSLGRPVLFTQHRRGRGLQHFDLLKFRTMRDPLGPDGQLLDDAERTPWVGYLLRRTRLDELPQLLNVLRGDMSLIGPRPLLDRDIQQLPDRGRERCRVRPGITGWAQVNGGHLVPPDDKLALDLWYIRHATPWLDLKILFLTIRMMLLGEMLNEAEIRRASEPAGQEPERERVRWRAGAKA